MATTRLPLYMQLGHRGPLAEVGSFELPVNGDGTLTINRKSIAAMLRQAADAYEAEPHDVAEGVPDAAAQQ